MPTCPALVFYFLKQTALGLCMATKQGPQPKPKPIDHVWGCAGVQGSMCPANPQPVILACSLWLKKLGRVGKDRPTCINLRRRLGFPDRENPQILAPP